MVLGIEDPWIWLAYVLCLLSTLLCIVYAVIAGSRRTEDAPTPAERAWATREKEVEDEV